jgi:hypothetical protein
MSEAIVKRLPPNTHIEQWGDREQRVFIHMSMTFTTAEQARALHHALDVAIIPILECGAEWTAKYRPDRAREAVAADFGIVERRNT